MTWRAYGVPDEGWMLSLVDKINPGAATAGSRQGRLSQLADVLGEWDPISLFSVWRAGGIHLNLTRLRRLASSLYRWREPSASVAVLERIHEQTARPQDEVLLSRRRRELMWLEGVAEEENVEEQQMFTRAPCVVVLGDCTIRSPEENSGGAAGTAVSIRVADVLDTELDSSEVTGRTAFVEGRAEGAIVDLREQVLEAVRAIAAARSIVAVVASGGALTTILATDVAKRWGTAALSLGASDMRAVVADAEEFAASLGMGEPPASPRYLATKSELHTVLVARRVTLSETSPTGLPARNDSPAGVTKRNERSAFSAHIAGRVLVVLGRGDVTEAAHVARLMLRIAAWCPGIEVQFRYGEDDGSLSPIDTQVFPEWLISSSSIAQHLVEQGSARSLQADHALTVVAGFRSSTGLSPGLKTILSRCLGTVLAPGESGPIEPSWRRQVVWFDLNAISLLSAIGLAFQVHAVSRVSVEAEGRPRPIEMHPESERDQLRNQLETLSLNAKASYQAEREGVAAWLRETAIEDPGAWFAARDNPLEEVIGRGWVFAEFPAVNLELPVDWDNACSGDRSWNFHLHAWRFMDVVMTQYLQTGEIEYLHWCIDRAVSWAERYVAADAGASMAWYDMALGLRSTRLAVLIWLMAREHIEGDELSVLLACAMAHARMHQRDDSFNPRTNHGFYAALGQTFLGRTLGCYGLMRELAEQGAQRLALMAKQQFHADGGHVEHSPDYHRMVLRSFEAAVNHSLVTDSSVIERLEKAEHALGWMVQPNGEILQFGDSPARGMVGKRRTSGDRHTEYIVTGGRSGEPQDAELFLMENTGYAFVRSPSPARASIDRSTYFALQAGFHSRAHKHADDLSVVWFDRGREILIDSGRYGYGDLLPKNDPLRSKGYYYADPVRQYVESTTAHNTVMVGDESHDRLRKPYGSAIERAFEREGGFYMSARADHESWTHSRSIVLKPGCSLTIFDFVERDPDDERPVTVWFNLNGDLNVSVKTEHELEVSQGDWTRSLIVRHESTESTLVAPARGLDKPLRGWRSKTDREIIPAWNVGWRLVSLGSTEISTTFELADSIDDVSSGGGNDHD